MHFSIIIILFLLIVVIVAITSSINANKKLRQRIMDSFGAIPTNEAIHFDNIQTYHDYQKTIHTDKTYIDNLTWNDLDMNDVFCRINACSTSIGEEYLYHGLHDLKQSNSILTNRERLISLMQNDKSLREEVQYLLSKLGKFENNGLIDFLSQSVNKKIQFTWIYTLLALLPILLLGICFINLTIGIACVVGCMILNGILYYWRKQKIEFDLNAIQYLCAILWCSGKLCKVRNDKFHERLTELNAKNKLFHKLSGKASGLFLKSSTDLDFMFEYLRAISLYDIRKYNQVVKLVKQHSQDLFRLIKLFCEVDISICILSFQASLTHFCTPTFQMNNTIHFQDLYHPLLQNAISNSGVINNDCVITGSNASGKSTFIKAIAINSILAQTIQTCSASSFQMKPSYVVTSMAVQENVVNGESYFIAEVKSMKRIMSIVKQEECLCFIDEILKGTNTMERILWKELQLRLLSSIIYIRQIVYVWWHRTI